MSRQIVLDTETTGLSGGCGTRIFLLGLARIDRGLLLSQYLLSRVRGEEALLDAARRAHLNRIELERLAGAALTAADGDSAEEHKDQNHDH